MRKAVRRRDDARRPVLALHLGRHRRREIAHAASGCRARCAILPTSVGSMPSTRWPAVWKFEISVPSFEPMSTTRSCGPSLSIADGFGAEIGEIVAQQLGGAAGVGIVRRKDDDRIDREPELHQLAARAVEQVGRKPRLLPRHFADRHHLVDRRHVAERQHGFERRMPADLAAFHRDACLRCRRHARSWLGTQCGLPSHASAIHARPPARRCGVLPIPPQRRRQSVVEAARAVYSRARQASKYRGSGAACCPRSTADGLKRDLAAGDLGPCDARARRWRPPRSCRCGRCRGARPSRASP